MSNKVVVDKGRKCVLPVSLGIDVSADTVVSEIRSEPDVASPLIAQWEVAFNSDGSDGELTLTLDNVVTGAITASKGYMDLKRVTGGEPFSILASPIEVIFQGTVTE